MTFAVRTYASYHMQHYSAEGEWIFISLLRQLKTLAECGGTETEVSRIPGQPGLYSEILVKKTSEILMT